MKMGFDKESFKKSVILNVKNIYRKLAVPSRTKAISEARARGLLS